MGVIAIVERKYPHGYLTAIPTARIIDAATRAGAIGAGLADAAISDTCVLVLAKTPWNGPNTGIDVEAVIRALRKDA